MLNSNEVLNGNFAASRRYSATHNGVDLKAPTGTIVKSRYAGVVRVTGTNPPGQDFGTYVRVFHPQLNQSTWYAHLQSHQCKVGQQVNAGQTIAISNNTGVSTGPHLHFGQSTGETTKWVDPDTQQSGGDLQMANRDLVNAYYQDLLGRPLDPSGEGYIGQEDTKVYNAIRTSKEAVGRASARQQIIDSYPGLQNQVGSLTSQLQGANDQIAKLDQDNQASAKSILTLEAKVAELEKKLSQVTTPPSDMTIGDLIRLLIKKITSGGQ